MRKKLCQGSSQTENFDWCIFTHNSEQVYASAYAFSTCLPYKMATATATGVDRMTPLFPRVSVLQA